MLRLRVKFLCGVGKIGDQKTKEVTDLGATYLLAQCFSCTLKDLLNAYCCPFNKEEFMTRFFQVSFWLILFAGLAYYFHDTLDEMQNPNRDMRFTQEGPPEVVLKRNRSGHYIAPGLINDYPVVFLVDTGATSISIPETVAKEIGLKRGSAAKVTTASGVVEVYRTDLQSVSLGGIEMSGVGAHINPHMPSDIVLLGMSFMQDLVLLQQDGELTLRIPE